jgi:hypothetical protein
MEIDATLETWLADPDREGLSTAALRLARKVPRVQLRLEGLLDDGLARALAGLEDAPDPTVETDLGRCIWASQACADAGKAVPIDFLADLEERATRDLQWWVPAARLHAMASPERERAAMMALSVQVVPYVFPGDLHPLQVDALAVADRVFTALHIDWLRKLTTFLGDVLVLDARCMGFWFWPHIDVLDPKKLQRPLGKVVEARKIAPGGRGMVAAYLARMGVDPEAVLAGGTRNDRWMAALAIASVRSTG